MSIVEKMAAAIYKHRQSFALMAPESSPTRWEQLSPRYRKQWLDTARLVITATGLTEAQLEGLANGAHVVVAARADLISWCNQWPYCGCKKNLSGLEVCEVSAMLAAKEG